MVGKVCSSLRANAKQSSETVITRSDERRSNLVLLIPHLEIKDFGPPASGGHGSYQCLSNADNILRNKCAIVCVGDMNRNIFNNKFFSRFTSHFSPKASAFTLAEVLITLSIIGVVAAMTIPTLVANYQKKETVTALKKAYSQLSQAVKMSELENGDKEYWNYDLPAEIFMNTYLKPFLKNVEQVNSSEIQNNINYKYLNGKTIVAGSVDGNAIKLSDGTMIFVDSWSPSDKSYRGLLVDTNGFKKPNILGRDLFAFKIDQKGVCPTNYDKT